MWLNVDLIPVSPLNDIHSTHQVCSFSPHEEYPLPVAMVGLLGGTAVCSPSLMVVDRQSSLDLHSSFCRQPSYDTMLLEYFRLLSLTRPVSHLFPGLIELYLPNEQEQRQGYVQQKVSLTSQHVAPEEVHALKEVVDAHMY